MTSPVSGKNSSFWPRAAAGRPARLTCRVLPSGWTSPPARALGVASQAAWKSAACSAVLLRVGSFRTKLPSSGMHSLWHTSQVALSSICVSPKGEGLKAGVTVSGTGNSTVPS